MRSMMRKSKYYKIYAATYMKIAVLIVLLNILFVPSVRKIVKEEDN